MYVCMCTTCIRGAHRAQKGISDLLELELLADMSHPVTLRTKPGSSKRVASVLIHCAISPAHFYNYGYVKEGVCACEGRCLWSWMYRRHELPLQGYCRKRNLGPPEEHS